MRENKISSRLLFLIFRDKNFLRLSNELKDKANSAFFLLFANREISDEFAKSFYNSLNLEKDKLNNIDEINSLINKG